VMNFSSLPGGIHQINSGKMMGSSDDYLTQCLTCAP
jgi:hypothetical protein